MLNQVKILFIVLQYCDFENFRNSTDIVIFFFLIRFNAQTELSMETISIEGKLDDRQQSIYYVLPQFENFYSKFK